MLVLVLLDDAAGQPTVRRDGEAVQLGPGTYLAAALAACCRPDADARAPRIRGPRVLSEGRELMAEFGGVS
jgi:hypothetical protein